MVPYIPDFGPLGQRYLSGAHNEEARVQLGPYAEPAPKHTYIVIYTEPDPESICISEANTQPALEYMYTAGPIHSQPLGNQNPLYVQPCLCD